MDRSYLRPATVVDKNGKVTTVHKKVDVQPASSSLSSVPPVAPSMDPQEAHANIWKDFAKKTGLDFDEPRISRSLLRLKPETAELANELMEEFTDYQSHQFIKTLVSNRHLPELHVRNDLRSLHAHRHQVDHEGNGVSLPDIRRGILGLRDYGAMRDPIDWSARGLREQAAAVLKVAFILRGNGRRVRKIGWDRDCVVSSPEAIVLDSEIRGVILRHTPRVDVIVEKLQGQGKIDMDSIERALLGSASNALMEGVL